MDVVMGPMTRSLDDLILGTKLYFSDRAFDKLPTLPRLTFNQDLYDQTLSKKRLKIGIIKEYETFSGLCNANKRALRETQELLTKLGHEVIEIEIPEIEEHTITQLKFILHQMVPDLYAHWSKQGDEIGTIGILSTIFLGPSIIPKIIGRILKIAGQHRAGQIFGECYHRDSYGWSKIIQDRIKHVSSVLKIWKEKELDTLILSPMPFPAFKSADAEDLGLLAFAARLAIYWQFSSGTMPITVVKEGEDEIDEKLFNDGLTAKMKETVKGSVGMPICLEFISAPYEDEKALAVMKIVEQEINFHEKHPYPVYE